MTARPASTLSMAARTISAQLYQPGQTRTIQRSAAPDPGDTDKTCVALSGPSRREPVPRTKTNPRDVGRATPTLPQKAASARPAPGAPAPGAPVEPVLADDQVLHLLRRATFGPTNEMVARIQDGGVDAWLDEQLAPESIDDSACEQRLRRFPMLDRTARQINDSDRDQGGQQRPDERLVESLVVRALCTERQLYELMVEFWANHFSIHTPSGDQWGRRTVADREVYRPHALGRFGPAGRQRQGSGDAALPQQRGLLLRG